MFKRRTREENPSHTGVSVLLTNQKNSFSSKATRNNRFLGALSQREKFDADPENSDIDGNTGKTKLKNLLVFLFYSILFASLVLALSIIDGPPHLPERWWSWQEIWTKLTGPADGLPLEFIKYLAATCGWMLIGYLAFTVFVQAFVDTFYLISLKRNHGHPGKLVTGLFKATRRFTMPPLRRALDGLLLTTVLFSVATTTMGSTAPGQNHGNTNHDNPSLEDLDHFNELLNSAPAMTIQAQPVKQTNSFTMEQNAGLIKDTQVSPHFKTSNIISNKYGNLQPAVVQLDSQSEYLSDTPVINQTAATETIQYVVKPGDSLWKLADYYYGDGHLYTRIYQANVGKAVGGGQHFSSAGIIHPGWVLTIPDVPALKVSPTIEQNGQTQDQFYVVQRGDTLRKISEKLLGNESRWHEIWQLNAGHKMQDGRVATSPDRIYPGWQFKLPAKPNGTNPTVDSSPAAPANGSPAPETKSQVPGNPQPTGNQQAQNNGAPGNGQSAPGGQNNQDPIGQQPAQTPPAQTTPVSTPSQGQPQGLSPANSTPAPSVGNQSQPTVTNSPSPATQTPTAIPATPKPTLQQTQPAAQSSQNPSGGNLTPKPSKTPVTAITPAPDSTPVNVQPPNSNKVEQNSEDKNSLDLPWQFIVGGIGSLLGFGFGLRFLASAMRRRWNLGLHPRRREKIVAVWPGRQAPVNRATPEVKIDDNGNETGFATTRRPFELIEYQQNEGVDTNKANLVLTELQNFFHELGLPELIPIFCTEGLDCLSYTLKGSPADISAYLEMVEKEEIWNGIEFLEEGKERLNSTNEGERAAEDENLEDDEEEDQAQNVKPLAGTISRLKLISPEAEEEIPEAKRNLQLLLESRFATIVLIEQSGDALVVHLEQIQPAWKFKSLKNHNEETEIETQEHHKEAGDQIEGEAPESGNVRLPQTAYTRQAIELARLYEEEELAELPAQQTPQNVVVKDVVNQVGYDSKINFAYNYTLLPVGSTSLSQGRYALSAERRHFHLALESGQLLLVSGQEDEAARTILYNSLFHLACTYNAASLELNLVDLPLALEEEAVKALLEANNSENDTGRQDQLFSSLKNRQLFQQLIKLPHTVKAVAGDNLGGISWRESLLSLLEDLETELNRRSVEQALLLQKGISMANATNLFRPGIIAIADLAAVMATDGHRMAALIENGPKYGLFIVGTISYESLTGEIALPQPLIAANEISTSKGETRGYEPAEMKFLLKGFKNIGLFMTVEESYSRLACGSDAALNLNGEGDMLLKMAPGQAIKLRGFALDEELRAECLELLSGSEKPEVKEPDLEEPVQSKAQVGAAKEPEQPKNQPRQEKEIIEQEKLPEEREKIQPTAELPQFEQNQKNLENHQSVSSDFIAQSTSVADLDLPESNSVIKQESSTSGSEITTTPPGELSVAEKLFRVRRALIQAKVIGPVLDIHILHGIDLRFCLLPIKRNALSLSVGSFFEPVDVLKVYELLVKENLALVMLEQESLLQHYPGTDGRPTSELDSEMVQLLEAARQGKSGSLLIQSGENARILAEVGYRLWNVCYGLESGNLTGHFIRNELELIGYLALLPKGQSKEKILSDLYEEDDIISERKAFDTRLSRTRSTLAVLLKHYLNLYFDTGSDAGIPGQEVETGEPEDPERNIVENDDIWNLYNDQKWLTGEKPDYFEEDNYGKIRLRTALVRVDDWELMQLLTAAASEKLRNPQLYVEKLDKIHLWIATTAKTHGEREGDANSPVVTDSLIKPLGTFGDKCNWDILDRKRSSLIELWYNTNLFLGNYYQSKNPAKAFYHYGQAHALFPTFEDPVLSLMQISHKEGDSATIRRVFRNYLKHCRKEGIEPATLVEGCYKSFTGDDVKVKEGASQRNPGNRQNKSKAHAVNEPKRYAKS